MAEKKEEKEAAPAKKEETEKPPAKEPKKKEEPKKGEPKGDQDEEKEEKKIIKESVHTINLRKAFEHPRTSRVKYAAREVKDYVKKHTRKEAVVDPSVNEALWAKGIQKPPRKIRVKIQEEENKATAVIA
ncbi:50S ribosomal protein L31e [archaeon]